MFITKKHEGNLQPKQLLTMSQKVTRAILQYQFNASPANKTKNYDPNLGYDILRYAKMGLIRFTSPCMQDDFNNWYPRNPDYLILEWAKNGYLEYRQPLEEQIQNVQISS